MAKSGQKRAFEDEAVQTTLPTEELTVTDRKAIDITPNLDAEKNRTGIYTDPTFFNELAKLSDTIHDVRRQSREYDYYLEENEQKLNYQAEETAHAQLLKRQADLEISDQKMRWATDYDEKKQEALRTGNSNFSGVVNQFGYDLEAEIDNENRTPYEMEQLEAFRQNLMSTAQKEAFKQDVEMSQNKGKFRLREITSKATIDALNGKPLDTVLDDLPSAIAPIADVAFVDKKEALNDSYNTILLGYAAGIEGRVKSGEYTVDEGQAALDRVMAYYQYHAISGKEKETDEKETSYVLGMDSKTGEEIAKIRNGLSQYRAKVDTTSLSSDYLEMIGYDTWKDGKNFDQSPYLRGSDMSRIEQDYFNVASKLVKAMQAGDPNAAKELHKTTEGYLGARTIKQAAVFFNTLNTDKGNSVEAASIFSEIRKQLGTDLDRGNVGQFDSVPSYLFYSNGATVVNLGFPTGVDFDTVMRLNPNQDVNTLKYNYYQKLYRVMENIEQEGLSSDKVSLLDPDYAKYARDTESLLVPTNLVSTDGKGHVVPNEGGVAQLTEQFRQSVAIGKKANNGSYTGSVTSNMIKLLAKNTAGTTPEIKAMTLNAVAKATVDAGVYGSLVTACLSDSLTPDEKSIANQLGAYALLAGAGGTVAGKRQSIYNMQISKTFPAANMQTADKVLANFKFPGFSQALEKMMNDKKVPVEYKPVVRQAVLQMYLADVEPHTGEEGKYRVDKTLMEKLIDGNFQGGVYVHDQGLADVDIDALLSSSTTAQKGVEKALSRLNVPKGSITVKVNSKNNAEEIYVGGVPLYTSGLSYISGSRLKPFALYYNNKPTGMPEQKYQNARQVMLMGATVFAAFDNIRDNAKMQEKLAKKGNGLNIDTFEQLNTAFKDALMKPETQQGFISYFDSNFTNTKVTPAPASFKALFVDDIKSVFQEEFLDREGRPLTQYQVDKFIDYVYTRMSNNKTARLDIPLSTHIAGQNIPIYTLQGLISKAGYGYKIDLDGIGPTAADNLPGKDIHKGQGHKAGTAFDLQVQGGFNSVVNDGTLDYVKFRSLYDNFFKPLVDTGYITTVLTSYPELVSGQGDRRIVALANSLRTSDGKKVFQYASNHSDHYHVETSGKIDLSKTKNPQLLANTDNSQFRASVANTIQTNVRGLYSHRDAMACAVQGINYNPTADDAKRMNRSLDVLKSNPAYKAQAFANRFVYYRDSFKSTNMAVAAMAGCGFSIYDYVEAPGSVYNMEKGGTWIRPSGAPLPGIGERKSIGVASSIKIPMNKVLSADQLIAYIQTFPRGAIKYKLDQGIKNQLKYQQALSQWIKDGGK